MLDAQVENIGIVETPEGKRVHVKLEHPYVKLMDHPMVRAMAVSKDLRFEVGRQTGPQHRIQEDQRTAHQGRTLGQTVLDHHGHTRWRAEHSAHHRAHHGSREKRDHANERQSLLCR